MTVRDIKCPRCEGVAVFETRTLETGETGYECARCHTRFAVAADKPEPEPEPEP